LQTFENELFFKQARKFENVTAEVYKNEIVREAFINGRNQEPYQYRQLQMENNELTKEYASNSINMALEHSGDYLSHESTTAEMVASADGTYSNGTEHGSSSSSSIPQPRKCSFSAKRHHEGNCSPALDAVCYPHKMKSFFRH